MYITMFETYLIMQIDGFRTLFNITATIIALIYVGWAMCAFPNDLVKKPKLKLFLPLFLLFVTLSVAIPSTKTLIAMYSIPQILQSEEVQKLPSNTLKALNKVMEDYIKEK